MNLKEKRVEKKLTQQQVADMCGITQVSYSYYEIGKRNPKPAMLKKFASVLDCTVDEILKDPQEEEDGRRTEDQGQDLVSEIHEDSDQTATGS